LAGLTPKPARDGPSWVSRPLFAGDTQPGMRVAAGGWGGTFGPATVLPDGLVELGGGMVAIKAMGDDGQVGVLTVPDRQAILELVEVPPLDDRCDCGAPDCGGAWPTLTTDPHPPPMITPNRQILGVSGSMLDAFIRQGRDCPGEDCCPTRTDPDPGECSDRPDPEPPYEPGGYL